MAGTIILGQTAAIIVVESISSAMPPAILPIISALAGATMNKSAFFAIEICLISNSKFLSKVSVKHLVPVRDSKVSGVINLAPF